MSFPRITFVSLIVCLCVYLCESLFLFLPFWACVVLCRMFRFCVFAICIFKSSLNISHITHKVKIFVDIDNFDNAG